MARTRLSTKSILTILAGVSLAATLIGLKLLGGLDPQAIQALVSQAGIAAPLVYMAIYVVAMLVVFPSSALSLAGGALFGLWAGTVWTSLGAIASALITFSISRRWGQAGISSQWGDRWRSLDTELTAGGLPYMVALRILPLLPYGLVNWMAGLTSVRFRDYLLGTGLGTAPGVLPYVWLGQAGVEAMNRSTLWPILLPMTCLALSMVAATWYKRHPKSRQPPSS